MSSQNGHNQSWIKKLVAANVGTESPEIFYYWSALATMSAVLGKRVFVNRWKYKLYPNLFVFLVAGSGMKKSDPVNLSRNLIDSVSGVRLISGRNSIQKVLEDLSKAHTTEDGGVLKTASGYIINTELASFLIKDPDALSILTDIYDTHNHEKEWKYNLRSGESKLREPCVSWLGATNEEHYSDCIPSVHIKGGLVGRILIVHSIIRGTINSLVYKPPALVDINQFTPFLKELKKVKGEINWTIDGGAYYDNWYNEFWKSEHYDNTGYVNRIGDHIIKVAMLIALSNNLDNVLRTEYIEEAKAVCIECFSSNKKVNMGSGAGQLSELNKIVMRILIKDPNHQIERKRLANRFWQEGYSTNDLDLVLSMLLESGVVSISGDNKTPIIVLKDSVLKQYEANL
jgi:hypothetical protein